MFDALRRNMKITVVFMAVRFAVTLLVCFFYLIVAAWVQWAFVALLGESTFNYIAGGIVSLVVGVAFCYYIGALVLMFVQGWHVAALAYADKIEKTGAFPLDVGRRAFRRNLVSFGAVYGSRALLKGVLSNFKDKLWTLSEEIPYGKQLKGFAQNPIVEHIAGDILHYGFDAAVYYLVREKPKNLEDVPATVLEAVKRYLYCLPSSMLSSISTFVLFRVLPKTIKVLIILSMFFTQGFVAGIFITVLMYPIFYILDNAVFDPLTMTAFLSAYAAKCDEEPDKDSVIYKAVNSILDDDGLGFSSSDEEKAGGEQAESTESVEDAGADGTKEEAGPILIEDDGKDTGPVDGGAGIITSPGVEHAAPVEAFAEDKDIMAAALQSLSEQFSQMPTVDSDQDIILPDAEDFDLAEEGESDADAGGGFGSFVGAVSTPLTPEAAASRFKDLNSLFSGKNLSFDPMAGGTPSSSDSDEDEGHDRASSILAGDDD